jgi:hypothetical protein
MAAHTPGPWLARKEVGSHRLVLMPNDRIEIVGGEHRGLIAAMYAENWMGAPRQDEANARLIAAAPELLAALDPDTLEAIADEIDCLEHSGARAARLRVLAKQQRTVLAKARGET